MFLKEHGTGTVSLLFGGRFYSNDDYGRRFRIQKPSRNLPGQFPFDLLESGLLELDVGIHVL
jgi:hypothetical protein